MKLTFLMPTYNREKTLGSALEILCKQIIESPNKNNFKIVISENHSTDKSMEISVKFAKKYKFIEIIQPNKHLGTGEENLFFALGKMDSDFVWTFADDDILLPGAIDNIYEQVTQNQNRNIDFFLINSQYKDTDGSHLSNCILDLENEILIYEKFSKLLSDVGPMTILASFSSAIFRLKNIVKLDFQRYLNPCPIYAHVFAYLTAYQNSKCAILKTPLVLLRKTTDTKHWDELAIKNGWYSLYPWTGGIVSHIIKATDGDEIDIDDISFGLNSNELGRYCTIHNMFTQFVIQLIKSIETCIEREVPPMHDFAGIQQVMQTIPYVTVDSLSLLNWGQRNFINVFHLLAEKNKSNKIQRNVIRDEIYNLLGNEPSEELLNAIKLRLVDKLHAVKSPYTTSGTMNIDVKPFVIIRNDFNSIYRLGSRYCVIDNEIFESNWQITKPNKLDSKANPGHWEYYNTFEDAFNHLKDANDLKSNMNVKPLLKYMSTPKWVHVSESYKKNDIYGFIKDIASNRMFNWLHTLESKCSDFAKKYTYEGFGSQFIDWAWYRKNFSRIQVNDELILLREQPMLHYLIIGSKKGFCPSPFIDENYYKKNNDANIEYSLFDFIASNKLNSPTSFFDSEFYLSQIQDNSIIQPILHYLMIGRIDNKSPHQDWDESYYLKHNPDVNGSATSPYYGWLHFMVHGRLENRKSSFKFR